MTRLEKKLHEELRMAIDICFAAFAREDEKHGKMLERMAAASTLCISTVEHLFYGYTQYPRYSTIQKIATAAGLAVSVGEGVRMSLKRSKRARAAA